MKVSPIIQKTASYTPYLGAEEANGAKPIYASISTPDKVQISTINRALDELSKVEFSNNDLIYVKTLGANPPFKSGKEALDWIKKNNAKIMYASFSNPNVHACLNYNPKEGYLILINSNYERECTHPDVLAISEAILHECGHGKDKDVENSIQEELDCMSLNVLAHRFYERKYPKIFENEESFLFLEGVSLYPKLFWEFDLKKQALKNRIANKYGYLQTSDSKHPATKLAVDIKNTYKTRSYV